MKEPNELDSHGVDITERSREPARMRMARSGGIAFFLVLNDHCDRATLLRQLDEFQAAGVAGLILHARDGLLVPYGSSQWFELISWLADECTQRGIEPVIYDEDPYPSGNASGRITAEHPELAGYSIERYVAPSSLKEDELFIFPAGRLSWVGIVFPEGSGQASVDLTERVGMIRRHWEKAEWDSRWYYPITPVYSCPRSFAHHAEFALRSPALPSGGTLVAFVAVPVKSGSQWGSLTDTLNPAATRMFLNYTHERYAHQLRGDGVQVRTLFTDEAKPHAAYSWTPGLFESFRGRYGYDLRPQLELLFGEGEGAEGMKVRLDYREWISTRFEEAWLKPVSRWCARRRIDLIGHFSPEEDPVNQSATIGNLFPLQKGMRLSGFDLIIPAVGDDRHPILNIAAVLAASAAQQNRQPGVCCESLGAFGVEANVRQIARVLAWQVVHGVTLGVLHGAFTSQVGLRRLEAPPDYGPASRDWALIREIHSSLTPFFRVGSGATQEAPVAVLWPIRSFHAHGALWDGKEGGLRGDFLELMQSCLNRQVGLHFLDEADLVQAAASMSNEVLGAVKVGRAEYQWILIPSLIVLGEETLAALGKLQRLGVRVEGVGRSPAWVRTVDASLMPMPNQKWRYRYLDEFRKEILPQLPQALEIPVSLQKEFRASIWKRRAARWMMLMYLGEKACSVEIGGQEIVCEPGDLFWFKEKNGQWRLHRKFSPVDYPDGNATEQQGLFSAWEMQLPDQPPVHASHPQGVWQLTPTCGPQPVALILTAPANTGGSSVAQWMVYRTEVILPVSARRATLLVEPTLMRGRFTLEVRGEEWEFVVDDTDWHVQRIDLSRAMTINDGSADTETGGVRRMAMTFTLHEPMAMDGIKAVPRLEVE